MLPTIFAPALIASTCMSVESAVPDVGARVAYLVYSATPYESQNNAALPFEQVATAHLVQPMCPASSCSSAFRPDNHERRVLPLLTPKRYGHEQLSEAQGKRAASQRHAVPIATQSHAHVQHFKHSIVQCCRLA